jgi:hypothetical protein
MDPPVFTKDFPTHISLTVTELAKLVLGGADARIEGMPLSVAHVVENDKVWVVDRKNGRTVTAAFPENFFLLGVY